MHAPLHLRYAADRRTLAFLVAHSLSVGLAFAVGTTLPPVLVACWVVLLCLQAFITAVITHNAVHVPLWTDPAANRLTQLWISVLYGGSVSVFVRGHNFSHHRHTQTPRDLMRTTKARFRWNLLNQLLFLFIVGPGIERGNHAFIARERARDSRWYRQFRLERWTVRLLTLAALLVNWEATLLFLLIPRAFGVWGISGINYAQHDGCDADHPANHSRNFVSTWTNWWLFNNGFHTAHHDAPHVHWSELPALHASSVAPVIHPALDQRSLMAFAWRQYVWPGRRVRYDGAPVVLPPPQPDASWLPEPDPHTSLGAAGHAVVN